MKNGTSQKGYYDKTFYTALGRERYIQMSKINIIIDLNKTLTVTFDGNGGTCLQKDKEVTYNSTYGRLPEATRDGYAFAGWYTAKLEGNKVSSATKVTAMEKHTLYARWLEAVTFDPNGGTCQTTSQRVVAGNKYGMLPVPERTGYTFTGWYTEKDGGTLVTSTTTVPDIGAHILYAHWTPALYMVVFNANGGNCDLQNKQVTYDSTYGALPTPTRTGYTFLGWYTEVNGGTQITASTIVKTAEQHTLYAHWNENNYTITYNGNGGSYNGTTTLSETATYSKNYTILANFFAREGYTFKGWNEKADGTGTDWTSRIGNSTNWTYTQNITLYAIWENNEYTITYNGNGGVYNGSITWSENVRYGASYTTKGNFFTRNEYKFKGWNEKADGTGTDWTAWIGNPWVWTYTRNVTLYAIWERVEYTVTFNVNGTGGTVSPSSKKVVYGNQYGTLPTPSRTGYTFLGWYTAASGGNKVSATTTVSSTQNHTLYAHWNVNKYTVTFNANGGSGAPGNQTKTYGQDLTISSKAPTRSGYEFLGWGTSSGATSVAYKPGDKYKANSNIQLYAVWRQIINVSSVSLDKTTDQWIPYKNGSSYGTLSLTATVYPSNADNKTVTWTSSNTSVATVNNGYVTAQGAGLATITATAGGKSASVNVYAYNATMRANTSYYLYFTWGSNKWYTLRTSSTPGKLILSYYGTSYGLWEIKYYADCSASNGAVITQQDYRYLSIGKPFNGYFTNYGAY